MSLKQFTINFLEEFSRLLIYKTGIIQKNPLFSRTLFNSIKFKYSSNRNSYFRYFGPGTISLLVVAQNVSFPISTPSVVKFKKQMAEEHNNLQSVIENADQLFDENHFQEVYEVLCKYQDQSLPEINWRKARALFQLSKSAKDKNEHAKLIRKSYDLVKSALDKDSENFAIHKWMAIILDAYAALDGIKSRVQQLTNVSFHMKRAVELNPNDPTSWYLLGSFEFGLADMPWVQRKIVSAIFSTPPTGTYEKALEYFQKAEEIKKGFYSMNWLMLGKCYYALKDYENAKKFFEKAANCRVLNEDDKNCKEEGQKLLKKV